MQTAKTVSHFIGGRALAAETPLERRNPSDTREVVALSPDGGEAVAGEAVEAARAALPAWRDATPEVRADVLDKAGALILERREDLGRLLSTEEGKTLPEGVGEAVRAGRIFRYFAGEAIRRHGQTWDSTRPGVEVSTRRGPVGVCALITPWNFPIAIPAWKSAPALAFGNTVVLKPSDLTPAMADALAGILDEAGAPPGVFNAVYGRGETGAALVRHPDVAAVSFTGSQGVGGLVAAEAARRQARVQLEMGGKNPLVVLADADLDVAVRCALDGAFFASGQRCTASSRLIVDEAVHDAFVERLAKEMQALRVGPALDPATKIGPLVSEAQLAKVQAYLDGAVADGAALAGRAAEPEANSPGWYFAPALLTGTAADMRINCEEAFGPLAAVIKVSGYEAALEAANAGEFGLSAGIVTGSLSRAQHFQRHVRAGMVMVNLPTAGVDYHAPFGGVGASSYGPREQGAAAAEFYTQIKTSYVAG